MVETKRFLAELIEQFREGDEDATRYCLEFFHRESKGIWHGRARAKIARNLQPHRTSSSDSEKLLTTVLGRLSTGNFSEQFKDQLDLALRISPARTLDAANRGLSSSKDHVRRYCKWTIERRCRQQKSQPLGSASEEQEI